MFSADDEDSVLTDFYGGQQAAVVSGVEDVSPETIITGFYGTEWDGRDNTGDDRLLLTGRYRIAAQVAVEEGSTVLEAHTKEPAEIEIGSPHASSYGPAYWHEVTDYAWDFTDDVLFSFNELEALGDASGFEQLSADESQMSTAFEALDRLISEDAVFHFVGQSLLRSDGQSPVAILFYDNPSPEGDPVFELVSGMAANSVRIRQGLEWTVESYT